MLDSKLEFAYLKLCFKSPEFWAIKFQPTDPLAQWVLDIVKDYQADFHRYPNLATFSEYAKGYAKNQQIQMLEKSFDTDLDEDFVAGKVIEFVKKQNMRKAIKEAKFLLDKDNITKAESVLLKSIELIFSRTLDYFKDKRKTSEYEYVTTGFKSLDRPLGGGLHVGNLGLIIGPKSAGKSLTMINFAVNATYAKEDVLHISFEDSEDQIAGRYDKRYSMTKKKPKGKLFVHVFPSGGANVADCEALVSTYKPRLVLIDYLNEMGWENTSVGRSEDFGERARGLRALSQRKVCSVWTAQQATPNKKWGEEDITAEDAFWSREPMQVADLTLTMNQTREERAEDRIRYNIDRHRNGPDGISLRFAIDYPNMFLKELKRF